MGGGKNSRSSGSMSASAPRDLYNSGNRGSGEFARPSSLGGGSGRIGSSKELGQSQREDVIIE